MRSQKTLAENTKSIRHPLQQTVKANVKHGAKSKQRREKTETSNLRQRRPAAPSAEEPKPDGSRRNGALQNEY